jgi:hypothetical protein
MGKRHHIFGKPWAHECPVAKMRMLLTESKECPFCRAKKTKAAVAKAKRVGRDWKGGKS